MPERIYSLMEAHNWTELKHFLNEEMGFQELLEMMEVFPPHQQVVLFRLFNKDLALEVFEVLEPHKQRELLEAFNATEVIELFSGIDPSDQVRIIDELPAKVAKELLKAIPRVTRDAAAILMGFKPGTVGRVITPHYLRLKRDMTVSEALSQIRRLKPDSETLLDIYITDKHRVLEGSLTLRDLVVAEPETTVGEIMDDDVVYVTADTDQEDAVNILKKFDLVTLPVVDSEQRLVGVLEYDRALDILHEEAAEDLLEKGGLINLQNREESMSQRLINGTLFQVLKVRLPFLMITLAGGLLAGLVIEQFEEAINTVVALAFFMPVVMDMGGNVGTQSTTIFTRSLVLGHVRPNSFMGPFLKEVGRGLVMGVILGIMAGIIGILWQGDYRLGLVVGISLFFTVTLAATLGFFIPWILYRLDFDQAAGAGPIITTIKDISGLLIYFGLATMLMGIVI